VRALLAEPAVRGAIGDSQRWDLRVPYVRREAAERLLTRMSGYAEREALAAAPAPCASTAVDWCQSTVDSRPELWCNGPRRQEGTGCQGFQSEGGKVVVAHRAILVVLALAVLAAALGNIVWGV